MRFRLSSVVLEVGVVVAAGCGGGSDHVVHDATGGERTIEVEMRDTTYAPDRVEVRSGESVRFVFRNNGKLRHDAFVGDEAAQMAHEDEMQSPSAMHHGESDAISVEPGDTDTISHTFAAGEATLIGCHEPGHYDAGMKLAVEVT